MVIRTTAICAATVAMMGTAGLVSPASALPANAVQLGQSTPAIVQDVQYRGRHWRGDRFYGHRRGRGDRWIGPAAGFAAGAILGGALSGAYARGPYYDDAIAWCAQRYRSYDPVTQTYMTYSGVRRSCP